ncbi:hypothetical protein [Labrys wisconsinensis]|uniref:Uncharacterized protein n=1 Tax=Labrys wisconsinensis TaxID=425677 RepID=A0ABU0J147_9HYPH|nr:hypothetical protein [Labrys wisconsinensis]MDQ0467974.1 hypothetical protein [Labrys wisconsinensis]
MSIEPWDRVHTVNKYYDGPELGIADYRGKPYIYEKQFDAADGEDTSRFLLSEIEPELLALVLEDWQIWLRWDEAYRQGEAGVKTHPALPEERERHDELAQRIGDRLRADPRLGIVKWARFRAVDRRIEVRWLDSPVQAG